MCGIVGYIGDKQAMPILLDGLQKLEYRGYDSAGISVFDGNTLHTVKKEGRLSVLESVLEQAPLTGTSGIGHTRWATHGVPSDENSHPHENTKRNIAVVHNGIIENHSSLKEKLLKKGYRFRSQTDSEVVAHLIDYYYKGDLFEAVQIAASKIEGSYALLIMCSDHPGEIIAARNKSPLVLGIGNGENFIASDVPALLKHTREVFYLDNGEFAIVKKDSITIYDALGSPVQKQQTHIDWNVEAAEKCGYPYFMLKEIYEEPKALSDTFQTRLQDGLLNLFEMGITEACAKNLKRVTIVACGTAYHAGLAGKYLFEQMLRIPVEVDVASEFRYRNPIIQKDELLIAISQSGETADTLAAAALAKKCGATVLALTNVVGSTLSREADAIMYTLAGPEIAVASTKAYTTQLMSLAMIIFELSRMRGMISKEAYNDFIDAAKKIPEQVTSIFALNKKISRFAHNNSSLSDAYFLGRNLDYAVSLEASLKLKEISYIHSEAFAAGELKHGPIALIEDGTLVVTIATQPALFEKTASNMKEVIARGAKVLAITTEDADVIKEAASEVFLIPKTNEILMPILSIIPMQLFAYYCAIERGFDPDKPRNLAKSVTVE